MNTTLQQDRAAEHAAKLETERADWFARSKTAAEAAGLSVKQVNNRCGVATLEGCKFDCTFIIEAFSPRTSYTSLKTYNRVVIGSYGHKNIWRSWMTRRSRAS